MVKRKPGGSAYQFERNVPRLEMAEGPFVFGSNVCREAHYRLPLYQYWCARLGEPPRYQRKQWEWVYIAQVLQERGMLATGMRGLGFGVGTEPLAACFAARGVHVVATDMATEAGRAAGWFGPDRCAGTELQLLNAKGICPDEQFRQRVTYRTVDMTAIPTDLRGFDFCWSSCSFEHLGTLAAGLEFVQRSLECLRPGGIAVHTTEFNASSNDRTIHEGPVVLYRRRDFEQLAATLMAAGHQVEPFDFTLGREPVERYVDVAPYGPEPQLRLQLRFPVGAFTSTSIGFVVRKGSAPLQ